MRSQRETLHPPEKPDSTILFRGSWSPEDPPPKPNNYSCVYFSQDFDYAASYAAGPNAGHDRKIGYVQKYELPKQVILDRYTKIAWKLAEEYAKGEIIDSWLLELFWDPPCDWLHFLKQRGYTGTSTGTDICIFHPKEAILLTRWKVEWLGWNGRQDMYRREVV